jgi:hypothetical protein
MSRFVSVYRFSVFFRFCFCIDILGATAESFAATRGSGMACAISYRDFVRCVHTVIVSGAGVIHGTWRSFALGIPDSSTVYKMLTFWLTHLFLDYVRTTIASSEC